MSIESPQLWRERRATPAGKIQSQVAGGSSPADLFVERKANQIMTVNTYRPYLAVVAGGLAAGIFDIVYAFVLSGMHGGNPLGLLQSIASGVLGAQAYKGGLPTAVLGLALHLGITIVAALVFVAAAGRSALIQRHYILVGMLFGVVVYLVMNFFVLPLSAVPFKIRFTSVDIAQGFVSHALLVGLPIAWCWHRYASSPARATPDPSHTPG
ncbi:MAG: hypothetical protein ABI537_07855 [Casimicrobiaceae bacterium]